MQAEGDSVHRDGTAIRPPAAVARDDINPTGPRGQSNGTCNLRGIPVPSQELLQSPLAAELFADPLATAGALSV